MPGWKPDVPWLIVARRGFGASYVCCYYSAPSYAEACAIRDKVMKGRRAGVPAWDSIEVREKFVGPRYPKKTPPPLERGGGEVPKAAKPSGGRRRPNREALSTDLFEKAPSAGQTAPGTPREG